MKLKKLFFGATASLMVLSLAACNGETPSSSAPSTPAPSAPVPSTPVPSTPNSSVPSTPVPSTPVSVGAKVIEAVKTQLEAAASFEMVFEYEMVENEKYWDSFNKEYGTFYTDEKTVSNIVVTKTKYESDYQVKIDTTYNYRESRLDEYVVTETTVYVLDGNLYNYDTYLEAWIESPLPTHVFENLNGVFDIVLGDDFITSEEQNQILGSLTAILDETISVDYNSIHVSYDGKPAVDSLIEYIKEIDPTKKTVNELINEVLAIASEDLTVEALLEQLVVVGNLTVDEALTEIDTFLTENYGTDLQGGYDAILADETVALAITSALQEQGMTEDEATAYIEEMKMMVIADQIPAEAMDVKLYDLLLSMFISQAPDTANQAATGSAPQMPTLEETVAQIAAMLELPIAEFEMNVIQMPLFTSMFETLKTLVVDDLSAEIEVEFDSLYAVKGVNINAGFQYTSEIPSYDDPTVMNEYYIDYALSLNISNISDTIVEINADEIEDPYFAFWDYIDYFQSEDGYTSYFYDSLGDYSSQNPNIVVEGQIEKGDHTYLIVSEPLYPNRKYTELDFTIIGVYYYNEEEHHTEYLDMDMLPEITEDPTFTITLNIEDYTYSVGDMPFTDYVPVKSVLDYYQNDNYTLPSEIERIAIYYEGIDIFMATEEGIVAYYCAYDINKDGTVTLTIDSIYVQNVGGVTGTIGQDMINDFIDTFVITMSANTETGEIVFSELPKPIQ